ncbi:TBC1 domain family member 17-like isoform X1 [Caloenas nicobarica]|uniref:TBC1 domain family member 17-like isoform X1 n=1 Tax=Caloenas nicobarica TaxID=187106 RepID=UPI0032B7DC13
MGGGEFGGSQGIWGPWGVFGVRICRVPPRLAGGVPPGAAGAAGAAPGPPRTGPPLPGAAAPGGALSPPAALPTGGTPKLAEAAGPPPAPVPTGPPAAAGDPPTGAPQAPLPRSRHPAAAGPCGGLSRLLGGPRGPPQEEGAEPEAEPEFEVIACEAGAPPHPPAGAAGDAGGVGAEPRQRGAEPGPPGAAAADLPGGAEPGAAAPGLAAAAGAAALGGPRNPGAGAKFGGPRDAYFRMKLQWRSLSPGQLQRNRVLRRYRQRLERDLARCPPDGPPRALLRDVLMTHCMFHFDLGYVRGMSEVLAPLLGVTPPEHEAFWGFCSIMEMVGSNFGPSREGLERQLGQLGQLVRVVEPELCERLGAGDTSRCCRRWLQLRFLPWLGTEGTRRVWEVLWTGLPCPNFHLLLVCVLLEMTRDVSPEPGDTRGAPPGDSAGDPPGAPPGDSAGDSDGDSDSDGDEGPPAVPLDAEQLLSGAEGLFLQLAAAPDLPLALRELLGLGGAPPRPPPDAGVPPALLPPQSRGDPPTAP